MDPPNPQEARAREPVVKVRGRGKTARVGRLRGGGCGSVGGGGEEGGGDREEEEEEEFFNHYKNDLKRHAHTPSGVAGADL